jgi:acylpyruvate hydrolase
MAEKRSIDAMRLLTFQTDHGTRAGRLEGDVVHELDAPDVGAILQAGGPAAAKESGRSHPVSDLRLATPVPNPPKVVCIGQNYEAHIREQAGELPKFPTLFNKWPRCLIGPNDELQLPRNSEKVDWEVELAFYIGKAIRHAAEDEALGAIAGYTVFNDVSMRDWQFRTAQWMQGKAWERSTPVGPWLVTPDEIDPLNLRVGCEVDGRLMQDSTTADLVFKPAQIAAYISEFITLEPGDLVATGTPSGVGNFRNPPVYLKPGSVMRTFIDGIGECVNECVPGE